MPKILKAGSVIVDKDMVVSIDIAPPESFIYNTPEPDVILNAPDEAEAEDVAETIISQANRQADDIRSSAEAEARAMLDDAKIQIDMALKDARHDGYEKGYDEGKAEAQALKDEAIEIYTQTVALREQTIKNIEPEMVALIIDIVDKLIHTTADINPAVIVNLIKQGLAGATLAGDIVIHVSEEDYEDAAGQKQALLSMVDASSRIEILKDFSLDKSDCVIETPFGNIDSSLAQQFAALKRDLSYIMNGDGQ